MNSPSLKVTVATGRSVLEGSKKGYGKTSEEYFKTTSICEMDPGDMKKLNITPNQNVRVTTARGNVILRATVSSQSPHPGIAYIPYGLWASSIMEPDTDSTGMPHLKGIEAHISPAPNEKVLSYEELVNQAFASKKKHF